MASKKPQDFGYQSYCEMYDSLKSKGVTNQTVIMKRMEANGTVQTHKIRMSTIQKNAWAEVAELMLSPDEIRELESVVYHSDMQYDKIVKVKRFLDLFRF